MARNFYFKTGDNRWLTVILKWYCFI